MSYPRYYSRFFKKLDNVLVFPPPPIYNNNKYKNRGIRYSYISLNSIDFFLQYLPLPNVPLPSPSPKGDYGTVLLVPILQLFEPRARQLFGTITVEATNPLTFEELGLPHWLVLYETDLVRGRPDPAILRAKVRDRALVYVDDHLVGFLSRTDNIYDINIKDLYGRRLKLLVENQGRLNYGSGLRDYKVSQSISSFLDTIASKWINAW